jgi:hypothetical protein
MDNLEQKIYEIHKPLRNKLRQLRLDDSLYVVWNYFTHYNNRKPQFTGIEITKEFMLLDRVQQQRQVAEWSLETFTREMILYCPESISDPKTLRKWSYFSDIVNKLKEVEEKIAEIYISKENVLLEFHRIGHFQFPRQIKKPTEQYFTRYFLIFSEENLSKLVFEAIGITIKDFYILAGVLWGYFLDKASLDYPPKIEVRELDIEKLDKLLTHISCNIIDYRNKLEQQKQINEKFIYSPRLARIFPIIKMLYMGKLSLVCIDSTLLFWRLTDGLYYEIYNQPGFSNSFGPSFQNYVGKVLKKVCKRIKYFPEIIYGSSHNKRDSIDWIIEDKSCVIFLECKTKRMTDISKIELLDTSKLDEDLDKMAEFIIQTYGNIQEYKENKYPHYKYSAGKKVYPMIVTLENWLLFGDELLTRLERFVSKRMIEKNLPMEWLSEMPYSVCSIDEFENIIQISEKVGLEKIMRGKLFDGENKKWNFDSFLLNNFPEEYKNCSFIFSDEFKTILPERAYE